MYTVDYFIKKFEAIPEENWCTGTYHISGSNRYCAFGHCGVNWSNGLKGNLEGNAFFKLLTDPVEINDGKDLKYQQSTPKKRILAALYDIKANQAVKQAEEIINEQTELVL